MKKKSKINALFKNNKFVFAFSLVMSFVIWCAVVITVSPQTTKVIRNVKVVIDESVSSKFGLVSFGDNEFYVDVTVTGKKYQISALTKDDIVVRALTNNVKKAGDHNLQLLAEPVDGSTHYTINSTSQNTINVFFDEMVTGRSYTIEPEIITNGSPIVGEGFSYGAIDLSEYTVNISGPASEINRIHKVVTKYTLTEPLISNLSTETQIIPVDINGNSDFKYLEFSGNVVLTIPVFKVKVLETAVYFKNVPEFYHTSPLAYVISPHKAEFDTSVDEYANIDTYYVGTIDFRKLSPDNTDFEFYYDDPDTIEPNDREFVVSVDLSGYTQDYFSVSSEDVVVNNPENIDCTVRGLSNIVVVGKQASIDNITEDKISVEIDLSGIEFEPGECKEVPATVLVDSSDCWVYGSYVVYVTAK